MRILHVSDVFLPKQGGIEVQVRDLALRQIASGHDVAVVTSTPPPGQRAGRTWLMGTRPQVDRLCGPDLAIHRIGTPWPHIPQTNQAVYTALRAHRPDVVHVHLSVLSPLSILALRAAVREGIPVVATLHSLWWWATALYALTDRVTSWGRWRVIWAGVSELAAEPLRRIVGAAGEVTVLPNGVDPADWTIEPVPRDENEVVVASVMRLALRKRPRALLKVVKAARVRLPASVRLRVVIVGDGPQRRALERRITRSGLHDCVELVGRLEHEEIRELYRRADLYVAPATLESFGIAALEARCAGLPVIARRGTGIADFISHGEHGLLAASDVGLEAALIDLASSPQRRSAMAAHNRASAPQTGWSEVLNRTEAAYKLARDLSAVADSQR